MRYYVKRGRSLESLCVDRIERGIQSIKNGEPNIEELHDELVIFFDKLEVVNKAMYEDLFAQYCVVRLEAEKELHA